MSFSEETIENFHVPKPACMEYMAESQLLESEADLLEPITKEKFF